MTRVPVSKKHTSSNESTKLVDETSSSYTYIHIHAHTFLSISPVHRSKKKKKKRIKEHTQASMCMLEKKKKEKLLLKLLHASYTRVYTICACISTSLLLLIDCSSSHLRENCFYLVSILIDERREKKKKERIELRGVSARILRVDLIRLPLKFARKFLGGKRRSRVEKVVCSRRGQFV